MEIVSNVCVWYDLFFHVIKAGDKVIKFISVKAKILSYFTHYSVAEANRDPNPLVSKIIITNILPYYNHNNKFAMFYFNS